MQDLCAEIADLIKTTKEEVMALSNKVKGDTNLVMEQLDGLEENLKQCVLPILRFSMHSWRFSAVGPHRSVLT
jgi:hypothetical protein